MKKPFFLILIFLSSSLLSVISAEEIVTRADGTKVVLYDDNTWAILETTKLSLEDIVTKNKPFLRSGIKATDIQIAIACEMYEAGWTYTMPRPKSSMAAWGVSDGRTTWYNGWWYNSKTKQYSDTTPQKTSNGLYLGDGQNSSHTWRNGGSPRKPDIFMFLLSKNGGPSY